ncbi:hypothetical protein GWK16_09590 [Roseomonas sp. JC162]|uniref:Rhamnan synthesis protein F n=1 Tax=Neoroseomonas marina TaxID=1232220 RepID=A0A848EBH7_9PROT|nr:hypothetical protein [Neoroseomonas marina]
MTASSPQGILAWLGPDPDRGSGALELAAFSLLGQCHRPLHLVVDLRDAPAARAAWLAGRLETAFALPGAPMLDILLPGRPLPPEPTARFLCHLPAGRVLPPGLLARLAGAETTAEERGLRLLPWPEPGEDWAAAATAARPRPWPDAPPRGARGPSPMPAGTPQPTPPLVSARRLPPHLCRGLALPLGYDVGARRWPRIAVLAHLYYAELGAEFRQYLDNIPFPADLFVTTDTAAKRAALEACFAGWQPGPVEIRVVPNRGRDVAPRLVGLADVHARYELCLHLHGKRSLHWDRGEWWRRDMMDNLLGTPAMALGAVEAFLRAPRLGIVMPRTWPPVVNAMDWGRDIGRVQALAARMGFEVRPSDVLEFPAGSMFWSRSAALRPLLDLRLAVEDFEVEDGLPRGSVAHAIERLMLHVCETAGYHWLRVGDPRLSEPGTLIPAADPAALDAAIADCFVRLTDPMLRPSAEDAASPELRAWFRPAVNPRPRLTLVLDGAGLPRARAPGGALHLFARMALAGGEAAAFRVAIAGDGYLPAELAEAEILRLPQQDLGAALPLGPRDVLLAAGPRGLAAAQSLRAAQAAHFGIAPPAVRHIATEERTVMAEIDARAAALFRTVLAEATKEAA